MRTAAIPWRTATRLIDATLGASSIVHGGGKRRMGVMIAPFPLLRRKQPSANSGANVAMGPAADMR